MTCRIIAHSLRNHRSFSRRGRERFALFHCKKQRLLKARSDMAEAQSNRVLQQRTVLDRRMFGEAAVPRVTVEEFGDFRSCLHRAVISPACCKSWNRITAFNSGLCFISSRCRSISMRWRHLARPRLLDRRSDSGNADSLYSDRFPGHES